MPITICTPPPTGTEITNANGGGGQKFSTVIIVLEGDERHRRSIHRRQRRPGRGTPKATNPRQVSAHSAGWEQAEPPASNPLTARTVRGKSGILLLLRCVCNLCFEHRVESNESCLINLHHQCVIPNVFAPATSFEENPMREHDDRLGDPPNIPQAS